MTWLSSYVFGLYGIGFSINLMFGGCKMRLIRRTSLFVFMALLVSLNICIANAATNSPSYNTMPAEELRRIAERGDPVAQYALGGRYEFGHKDVEKNKAQADMWQRKAFHAFEPKASNGDPIAQFYLGMMYKGGYGVSADRDKARGLLRKAAEQGVTRATEVLLMDILDHPSKNSFVWFKNAAVRGDTQAKIYMGTAYAEGKYIPTDNDLSYMWYCLAAKDGDDSGAAGRDTRAKQMTSAQIEHAEQMATEWLKNNPRTIKPITLPY